MSTEKAAETAEASTPPTAPDPNGFARAEAVVLAVVARATTWSARAGAVVLAVMLLLTFADVIGREILSAPIVANIEMIQLLMGLVVYLGVSLTTRVRGHVRVDILLNVLPRRVRAFADTVTLGLCMVFVAAMAWRLFARAVDKFNNGDETDLWKIPTWPFASIMTLCAALMALMLMFQWFQAMHHAVTGVPPAEDDTPQGGL